VIAYFDTSALVKLLIDEPGSEQAIAFWNGTEMRFTSRVTYAEVRSALAAAYRDRRLNDAGLRSAKRQWRRYWDALRVVETGVHLDRPAGDLAERHSLGGVDALHVASAAQLRVADMVVATWDRRLHAAAAAEGLATLPAAF